MAAPMPRPRAWARTPMVMMSAWSPPTLAPPYPTTSPASSVAIQYREAGEASSSAIM